MRPEVYWDRNGRLTGLEQVIKAMTTTLEYKFRIPRRTRLRGSSIGMTNREGRVGASLKMAKSARAPFLYPLLFIGRLSFEPLLLVLSNDSPAPIPRTQDRVIQNVPI